MNEPFNDFERLIKSRLDNFVKDPDETIRASILDKVSAKRRSFDRRKGIMSLFAILMISLSIYFFRDTKRDLPLYDKIAKEGSNKAFLTEAKEPSQYSEVISDSDDASLFKNVQSPTPTSDDESPVEPTKEVLISCRELPEFLTAIWVYAPNELAKNKIIPIWESKRPVPEEIIDSSSKKRSSGIYGDILTFWTYQRMVPNRSDELVVNSMNSSGLLSAERMGFRIDMGGYVEIANSLEVFGGLSAKMQQFATELDVRSLEADYFSFSEKTQSYIPHYSYSSVKLSKKVWSLGSRVGLRYYLPYGNRHFSFAPSANYQRILADVSNTDFSIPQNQVFLNLDFGWSYPVSKNINLNLSPCLSYSLIQKEEDSSMISIFPYSWGFTIGISYQSKL